MMWTALNCAAWAGWCALCFHVADAKWRDHAADVWSPIGQIRTATLALESLCCVEVLRMVLGSLRGNVTLGVALHYIRLFMCLAIFPHVSPHPSCAVVLLVWSATEICRYPFYVVGGPAASKLRYTMPLLTFPLGAGSEVWAIYTALPLLSGRVLMLAKFQVAFNILGGLASYPGLVAKALKALRGEAKSPPQVGILFPADAKGVRSTTAAGKSLAAAAIRGGGGPRAQQAAAECERERNWRFGYPRHLLKLLELGLEYPEVSVAQARAGLAWARENFLYAATPESEPVPLGAVGRGTQRMPWRVRANAVELGTLRVAGAPGPSGSPSPSKGPSNSPSRSPARTPPDRSPRSLNLRVPFNGAYARGCTAPPGSSDVLAGPALREQLRRWATAGSVEPDAAKRCEAVMDFLGKGGTLRGCHFVVIGASSAMGPAEHLLALGAHVIGISRGGSPASERSWRRLFELARRTPGAVLEVPRRPGVSGDDPSAAGADILTQLPELCTWLTGVLARIPKGDKVIIGNYTYLDGELHVKLTVAADVLISAAQAERPKVGVAFLGTPTDAHFVPAGAYYAARVAFASWLRAGAPLEAAVHLLTLGYKLAPSARRPLKVGGREYYLNDSYSVAQGPNYALAKRLQHWRCAVTFAQGGVASNRVAPSTATGSVLSNRSFAWAFLGMPYFRPLEVFKQETASALMTVLLLADVLNTGDEGSAKDPDSKAGKAVVNTLEISGSEGVHGGVWRCGYKFQTIGEVCVLAHFLGGPRVFRGIAMLVGWVGPIAAAALLAGAWR